MNYSAETLELAMEDVRQGRRSFREASENYNIPRSTISDKLREKHPRHQGGQTALTADDERFLSEGIAKFAEWGFPLTRADIQDVIKSYLDRKGVRITKFKENKPGEDWFYRFIKRNNSLTERLAQNIKRVRAGVDRESIVNYFTNLRETLQGIPATNIVNYDETNMSDDPGRVKVLCRRGSKRVERIMDSSKSSISIMMAISASGQLLPPYTVYKATHLYPTWVEGGVEGAYYNRTKSGWFDGPTFEDWFDKIALPYLKNLEGPKVLIGDNLASHVSLHVLQECQQYNIQFVLLPPNATHLLQPLDVAFFAPLKKKWRTVLGEWKATNKGCIPKSEFPRIFKRTLTEIQPTMEQNIKSGFRACGIFPLNPDAVLAKIPEPSVDVADQWSESFVSLLKNRRFTEEPKRKRGKRLNVTPGKAIKADSSSDSSVSDLSEQEVTQSEAESDIAGVSNDEADEIANDNSDEEHEIVGDSVLKYELPDKANITVDTFVVARLTTKKKSSKNYVACVKEVVDPDTYMVHFLRKHKSSKIDDYYAYPQITDESVIERHQLILVLRSIKNLRRGRYQFEIPDDLIIAE